MADDTPYVEVAGVMADPATGRWRAVYEGPPGVRVVGAWVTYPQAGRDLAAFRRAARKAFNQAKEAKP